MKSKQAFFQKCTIEKYTGISLFVIYLNVLLFSMEKSKRQVSSGHILSITKKYAFWQ